MNPLEMEVYPVLPTAATLTTLKHSVPSGTTIGSGVKRRPNNGVEEEAGDLGKICWGRDSGTRGGSG